MVPDWVWSPAEIQSPEKKNKIIIIEKLSFSEIPSSSDALPTHRPLIVIFMPFSDEFQVTSVQLVAYLAS